VRPNDGLLVVRQPDNAYDRNAFAVKTKQNVTVGHGAWSVMLAEAEVDLV
jgi:hypothetical protein